MDYFYTTALYFMWSPAVLLQVCLWLVFEMGRALARVLQAYTQGSGRDPLFRLLFT
jgi:hypothetical protein